MNFDFERQKARKTTFIKNQGQQSCNLNLNKRSVRINFEAEPQIYSKLKKQKFNRIFKR